MKSFKTELKWALIFGATLLIWMWGEKALGYHDEKIDQHMIVTNLFFIPAVVLYVLAILDKRKRHYDGKMNYKQGFLSGLIMTGIFTLFVPLTQVITSLIITPAYFDNVISYVVEHNMMTVEAAQDQFNLTSYIIQGMIAFPITGAITSAIVAIFTRRS
ncbi:MAG: DUF4199 domain-containing protein [Cytophagales bacterium]|nr:DUF4199 domain-containing protein [Cytophagales bacterium]